MQSRSPLGHGIVAGCAQVDQVLRFVERHVIGSDLDADAVGLVVGGGAACLVQSSLSQCPHRAVGRGAAAEDFVGGLEDLCAACLGIEGDILCAWQEADHKACGGGLHGGCPLARDARHGGVEDGLVGRRVNALCDGVDFEAAVAVEHEFVAVHRDDASLGVGLNTIDHLVAAQVFASAVSHGRIDHVAIADECPLSHLRHRREVDVEQPRLVDSQRRVVIDNHAKLGSHHHLSSAEGHIVDALEPREHGILDVGQVEHGAIVTDDVDVAVEIGNDQILLVVVVVDVGDEHIVELVALVDRLVGHRCLVEAKEVIAYQIVDFVVGVDEVGDLAAHIVGVHTPVARLGLSHQHGRHCDE